MNLTIITQILHFVLLRDYALFQFVKINFTQTNYM